MDSHLVTETTKTATKTGHHVVTKVTVEPAKPVAALLPPGHCQFGEEWVSVPLVRKSIVSHDVRLFTFALPDSSKPLGLSTCACILARGSADAEGNAVVRPYTPISTNATVGTFDLMVKVYEKGVLSNHMDSLSLGDELQFKHIAVNVKIQAPMGKSKIGMLVGGTGITPMLQVLHAVLGSPTDKSRVVMLNGNRTSKDILAKATLDAWCTSHREQLEVVHALSNEPTTSDWKGKRGRIDEELMRAKLPPPSTDCLILVCGPPSMTRAFCGPRNEASVSGLLAELGYNDAQVFKF